MKRSKNNINIKQYNNTKHTTGSPIIWPADLIKNSLKINQDDTINDKPIEQAI